jgi:hypothetical protein
MGLVMVMGEGELIGLEKWETDLCLELQLLTLSGRDTGWSEFSASQQDFNHKPRQTKNLL